MGYYFLQPLYLKYQGLQSEGKSLSESIKTVQTYTDPLYQPPLPITDIELEQLNKKIPVGDNHPEFMSEIQQKIEQSGATFLQLKRINQLPKALDQAVKKEVEKIDNHHLKPIWIQCDIELERTQLPALLQQLQSGERLVSVLGWDIRFENQGKSEKATLYLAVYMYEDERVKEARIKP